MPDHSFAIRLIQWFLRNARPMPWRVLKGPCDPYRVWISEVMLQQTTVATVIKRYEKWLSRYPSINALSKSSEQEVLKEWQGLGYYSRARNLLKCAKIIVDKFNGRLPSTASQLREFPGFGPYTAAAVASICFGQRIPLVDANVRRVMMRVLAIRGASAPLHDRLILDHLHAQIPLRHPGHFNQALMELGALICRPASPSCNQCPVRGLCKAYHLGVQELIPEPRPRNITTIDVVVAIIRFKDKVLIQQRPAHGLLAGLWEFPGGKIEPGDKSPQDALRREVLEETGLTIQIGRKLGGVVHSYTRFKVNLTAFECFSDTKFHPTAQRILLRKSQFEKYPMPSGSAKLIDRFL